MKPNNTVHRGPGATAVAHGPKPGLHRRRYGLSAIAFLAALIFAVTLAFPSSPAQAAEYPSWQDLQAAKANTTAAAEKVTQIQGLIANLQVEVEKTQAEAVARGAELEIAQNKFDDATRRAEELQAQADESKDTADAATKQAGQLASQLYRTGGTDLSVNLFLDGKSSGKGADELLDKLGSMSKLVERSSGIYEEAQTATNNAKALGDQAKIAQIEREKLRIEAEAAMVVAQAAADAAAEALAVSEAKSIELSEQLKFLQDAEATTAVAYQAGVEERKRQAAAAAAAAGKPTTPGPGLPGGSISPSGWAVPATGRITDGYGPRPVLCSGGYCSGSFHYGVDLGTGCGARIYAAHAGRVEYAGLSGSYGNFVLIDHGDGIKTGYAHIRDGGTFVGVGQQVDAGQNIASSGTTGASTGCHLHFEVRSGGSRINPAPFMAERGAPLG
ncbi:MAG TPA: peptidoglycan DD-metalloendopeptidase family protein [Glaciibacter sp.]|nr:peptidoglycan DD-metalloendopeptidase family protein [Glaciibacter sp.]